VSALSRDLEAAGLSAAEEKPRADCGRCGLTVMPNEGMVVYIHPDPASTARILVHAVCIADEVAEGSLTRVSGFAYRAVAVSGGDMCTCGGLTDTCDGCADCIGRGCR
jgi:hypothetical protein